MGILVGMLLGVSCDPLWRRNCNYPRLTGEPFPSTDRTSDNRLVDKNDGISEPEFRLPPTIMGAVIVPISLFGKSGSTADP